MSTDDRPTATRSGPVRAGKPRPCVSGQPPGRKHRACWAAVASSSPAVQGLLRAWGRHQRCEPHVGCCPSVGHGLRQTGMRGPSGGTPARPSDACRSRPGPERDRSPLTRRLSVLRTGPFSPAWWWSPHEIIPSSPGRPPARVSGAVLGREARVALAQTGSPSPGCTVPSGLHAGGRDPVHAPSPTGCVPRALGDFSGQRARGVRCLQAEGALGGGGGGQRPRPLP